MTPRPAVPPFESKQVERAFSLYEPRLRRKLLALRRLVFAVSRRDPAIGTLTETLKWGQPSYVTTETKSGTTLRIGEARQEDADYAMFFHCRTTLIPRIREAYADTFVYEGNRAILFRIDQPMPNAKLTNCISMALTYHLDKRRGPPRSPGWR